MSSLFSVGSKFGFTFFLRVVVPGLMAALVLLPLFNPLLPKAMKVTEPDGLAIVVLPGGILFGFFLSLFSSTIYQMYEGRTMWPLWFSDFCTDRLSAKVKKKFDLAESPQLKGSMERRELWYWLRIFPLDDKGNPCATRPSLLGNVMEGYERYSLTRYGMDSVFYWYRLWLKLPKNVTDYLDLVWAEAECLLHTSFVFLLSSFLYLLAFLFKLLMTSVGGLDFLNDIALSWPVLPLLVMGALLSLMTFYLVYRLSIPLHRRNGEYFKSLFDVFRNEMKDMKDISEEEIAEWQKTWLYLQYHRLRCPHCQNSYSVGAEHECLQQDT